MAENGDDPLVPMNIHLEAGGHKINLGAEGAKIHASKLIALMATIATNDVRGEDFTQWIGLDAKTAKELKDIARYQVYTEVKKYPSAAIKAEGMFQPAGPHPDPAKIINSEPEAAIKLIEYDRTTHDIQIPPTPPPIPPVLVMDAKGPRAKKIPAL